MLGLIPLSLNVKNEPRKLGLIGGESHSYTDSAQFLNSALKLN